MNQALHGVGLRTPISRSNQMPEETSKVIEAQRFILRDAYGRMRAELGQSEDNSVRLRLYDSEEHCRVELVAAANGGAGLCVLDAQRDVRVVLGLDQEKPLAATPALTLIGKNGKGGLEIAVNHDGTSFIEFFKGGETLLRIPDSEPNLAEKDG